MIPKFYGFSKDGNIKFERWNELSSWIMSLDGKRLEIVVKEYKKKRSNEQNRYYHGVIIPVLAEYFGYTHDEMHDAIKIHFLQRAPESGKPFTVGSTAKLTTEQFKQLTDDIKIWAATEYGVFIPDPHEVEYGIQ